MYKLEGFDQMLEVLRLMAKSRIQEIKAESSEANDDKGKPKLPHQDAKFVARVKDEVRKLLQREFAAQLYFSDVNRKNSTKEEEMQESCEVFIKEMADYVSSIEVLFG